MNIVKGVFGMYISMVLVGLPIYKEFYLSSIQLCEKKHYSNEIKVRLIGPYLSYTIAALKQESIRNLSGTNKYGKSSTIKCSMS